MNRKTYRALILERQGSGFTEPEVMALLSQVLPQLVQLHQRGIAHGGISPDTLVQDATQQADLIAAQPLTDSGYIAPECLQTGQATPTGDVYGLGVTLLTLLTAQPPQMLQSSPGIWNWRTHCFVSNSLAALLERAISFHPQLRYADAMQMFQALQSFPDPIYAAVPTLAPPTASPQASQASQTVPVSTTIPVAAPSHAGGLPWRWVMIGVGSLLLCVIGFAVAQSLDPSRNAEVGSLPTAPDSGDPTPAPIDDADVAPDATSPDPDNPFAQESFPKATCGDAMPVDLAAFPVQFHPVFVPNRERNLRTIRSQFCEDALPVTRKDTAQKAIQVASFTSLERAEQFQQYLAEQFEAEIGEATVYERPEPEPESTTPDPDPTETTAVETERVTFAPGETGNPFAWRSYVSPNPALFAQLW